MKLLFKLGDDGRTHPCKINVVGIIYPLEQIEDSGEMTMTFVSGVEIKIKSAFQNRLPYLFVKDNEQF